MLSALHSTNQPRATMLRSQFAWHRPGESSACYVGITRMFLPRVHRNSAVLFGLCALLLATVAQTAAAEVHDLKFPWWSIPFVITAGTTLATSAVIGALGDSTHSDSANHDEQARRFAAKNYDMIRRDAAVAGGEYLQTLAALLPNTDGSSLGSCAQAHFSTIFPGDPDRQRLLQRLVARCCQ